VTWGDIVPSLLTGLREGLAAGLVVSILLAAVRRAASARADGGQSNAGQTRKTSAAPIWLGVLGAVMLSGSCSAVLTSSASSVSGQAQNAIGGLLSMFAVVPVTAVIFRLRRAWICRAANGRSARPRGDTARVVPIGTGLLTITAFLAVSRVSLGTTRFLWTAARAPGERAGPLAGTAAGLAAAVVLGWLLYRGAVRLNARAFVNRAALALIVIAAGMLAQGLGDLQDAGLLPGQRWIAFDLAALAHPGSWWVTPITGVTGLSPTMTVLQAVAWIAYLAVGVRVFATAGHPAAAPDHAAAGATSRWQRLAGQRPWAVAGVLVVVPALAAGTTIAVLPAVSSASAAAVAVTVTRTGCAREWTAAAAGTQTFTVDNQSGLPGEINLDDASGDIVAEIETIGPGTRAQLTATLYGGTYLFKCFMGSRPATVSQPVRVNAAGKATAVSPTKGSPVAIKPVTVAELAGPNKEYQAYAARQLADLAQAVTRLQADLRRDDMTAAKDDWLTAQLDWERVGASYDSFGALGLAVDGLPDGLPDGVNDKNFTGLQRLEYGLWHGQSAAALRPAAATLASKLGVVRQNLASDDLAGDPVNEPVRAHEILEDALRDHLSGIDDQGGGAAFAQTYADVDVTRAVLGYLAPLINARQPGLPAIAGSQLDILDAALLATRVNGRWGPLAAASAAARERVDAAVDAVLETLAAVPDLLEVRPAH
jgi:high-affinity iron transporter